VSLAFRHLIGGQLFASFALFPLHTVLPQVPANPGIACRSRHCVGWQSRLLQHSSESQGEGWGEFGVKSIDLVKEAPGTTNGHVRGCQRPWYITRAPSSGRRQRKTALVPQPRPGQNEGDFAAAPNRHWPRLSYRRHTVYTGRLPHHALNFSTVPGVFCQDTYYLEYIYSPPSAMLLPRIPGVPGL